MKIEQHVLKTLKYLVEFMQQNNIDCSLLMKKIDTLKIVIDNSIRSCYGNYDRDNNILKYNPSLYNGKKNVLGHECLHIAGGFEDESYRGFNEFVTQFLNHIILGNKKGYFDEFDFDIISDLCELIGLDNLIRCYFNRNSNEIIDIMIEQLGDNRGNMDAFDFLFRCDKLYHISLSPFSTKKGIEEEKEKLQKIIKNNIITEKKMI